jgi:chemotaxis protein methyltransferase CheR
MLLNQQFDRIKRLALNLAGIELVERHRELLDHKSRRVGIHDSAGMDALLSAAEAGQTPAVQQLLSLLTTKFTGFFRHRRHFELAAQHAERAARERGRARLWSAAAATGEEPYSLAMALLEVFQQHDPPAEILATDVDVEALAVARRGEYNEAAFGKLAPAHRQRFLQQSSVPRCWSIAPAVRRLIEFRAMSLSNVAWPIEGPFDVIFSRNVLMYLEAGYRYTVLERMASLLAPDGLLFLDPAENPGKAGHLFASGADGVWVRRHASGLPQLINHAPASPMPLKVEL